MIYQIVTEKNFYDIIKTGSVIVNFTSNRTGKYCDHFFFFLFNKINKFLII